MIVTKHYSTKALHLPSGNTACDQNQKATSLSEAKFRPGRAIVGGVIGCSETTLGLFYYFFFFLK